MPENIRLNRPYYPPFIPSTVKGTEQRTKNIQENSTFADILNSTISKANLQFSQHAINRMQGRGIHLSDQQLKKLEDAVNKVSNKGGKDALVIMQNNAFIVNAQNKTVITAIDQQSLKDHVFTQIDSTILI